MTVENVAKIAHELNTSYCRSIGDDSQPSWEDAPEWQKESAVNGVKFHLEHPDASPSASHESWLKQKTEEGWKYGAVKNPETKEHPCFVPYEQLPTEQKSKDYLFKQVIDSLRGSINSQITDAVTQSVVGSFGQKVIGVFNPSNDPSILYAKQLSAALVDLLNDVYDAKENKDDVVCRMVYESTVVGILSAQMNIVKLITY